MSSHFNLELARERYSREDTEALIRIAFLSNDTLVPEAIQLAREELGRRGVDSHQHPAVAQEQLALEEERADAGRKAEQPLHTGLKVVCFIFADIFAVIIALLHSSGGKKRAAREAWKWMAYGWLARIGVIAVAVLTTPKP